MRRTSSGCGLLVCICLTSMFGSALLLYDSSRLGRDRLMEMGVAWAVWLDEARAGRIGPLPQAGAPH